MGGPKIPKSACEEIKDFFGGQISMWDPFKSTTLWGPLMLWLVIESNQGFVNCKQKITSRLKKKKEKNFHFHKKNNGCLHYFSRVHEVRLTLISNSFNLWLGLLLFFLLSKVESAYLADEMREDHLSDS